MTMLMMMVMMMNDDDNSDQVARHADSVRLTSRWLPVDASQLEQSARLLEVTGQERDVILSAQTAVGVHGGVDTALPRPLIKGPAWVASTDTMTALEVGRTWQAGYRHVCLGLHRQIKADILRTVLPRAPSGNGHSPLSRKYSSVVTSSSIYNGWVSKWPLSVTELLTLLKSWIQRRSTISPLTKYIVALAAHTLLG